MFEWLTGVIEQTGYVGIALLMFLENVFPPIPSEMIMPLAGFTAAQGKLSLPLVLLSGSIGSLAGAYIWYLLGLRWGRERVKRIAARHGRWITMCPPDVDRAADWFDRHGGAAVLFGRVVPAVRSMISVPAGIERMPVARFLLLSMIGTLAWTGCLVAAGYLLESQYARVSDYLNPVSNLIFGALFLWYAWRVATFGKSKAA